MKYKDKLFCLGYNAYVRCSDIVPPKNANVEQKQQWYDGWEQAVRDHYEYSML